MFRLNGHNDEERRSIRPTFAPNLVIIAILNAPRTPTPSARGPRTSGSIVSLCLEEDLRPSFMSRISCSKCRQLVVDSLGRSLNPTFGNTGFSHALFLFPCRHFHAGVQFGWTHTLGRHGSARLANSLRRERKPGSCLLRWTPRA